MRETTAPPMTRVRDGLEVASAEDRGELPTANKLRVWGTLSAYSLADQALMSLAGFFVNLLLARWMTADVYGAFAVAFAGYLFVCGFYNVIVLEPMSVMGLGRHAGRLPAYFREQIVIHAKLVGFLSTLVLAAGGMAWHIAPHTPLAGAILGSGLALPFLLFLWLVRRICYVLQRPSSAILGSATHLSLVICGLYILRDLGKLSPFSAFLLTGSSSFLAASFVLRRFGITWSGPPVSWSIGLQENWSYGRWLAGSAVLYSISAQTQTFLAASLLGLGAAGVLRAMQLPALVITQVVTAAGLLVLPTLSRDFARGSIKNIQQKVLLVSAGLTGTAVCFAGLVLLLAGRVEHLLFAGKYASFAWLMPILALMPVADALASGSVMALRASQKPQFDLIANAVAAVVGLLCAVAFIRWWGLAGVAVSLLAGCTASASVNLLSYRYFTTRWSLGAENITRTDKNSVANNGLTRIASHTAIPSGEDS